MPALDVYLDETLVGELQQEKGVLAFRYAPAYLDPEQLADWLSGRHKPCRRNREKLKRFLGGCVEKMVSSSRANG